MCRQLFNQTPLPLCILFNPNKITPFSQVPPPHTSQHCLPPKGSPQFTEVVSSALKHLNNLPCCWINVFTIQIPRLSTTWVIVLTLLVIFINISSVSFFPKGWGLHFSCHAEREWKRQKSLLIYIKIANYYSPSNFKVHTLHTTFWWKCILAYWAWHARNPSLELAF